MKYYEVQGKRICTMPEEEALLKLKRYPLNAELIVWDGRDITEVTTVESKIADILDDINAD